MNDFMFIIIKGATHVTFYTWHFGDAHSSTAVQGLSQAQSQTHMYSTPGIYTVIVTAHNNGGNNSAFLNITVQGKTINDIIVIILCIR